MEHHHRTRHPHYEVSSGSCSPNDDLEHDGNSQVTQRANSSSTNNNNNNNQTMNSAQKKCSLSDIWRMSSSAEIASKLVLMTQAPRMCAEMRADGVLPLLVQLLHQHSTEDGMLAVGGAGALGDSSPEDASSQSSQLTSEMLRSTLALRRNSAKALRNIINNTSKSKKELKVLGLLEDLRSFVEILYLKWSELPVDSVDHPCSQLAEIFTIACDQECKKIIETLGGVYVISDVIQSDFCFHRCANTNQQCYQLRQYTLNILTHLSANNSPIKSLLGSMRPLITLLVETLQESESAPSNVHLIQAVANVLHNLSWKTDYNSKQIMRDAQTVTYLVKTAMATKDPTTLNALLEPLLNLTAHCAPNKADFCKIDGALDFLISIMSLPNGNSSAPSRSQLAIVENSGGILRNVSSYLISQEQLMEQIRARNIIALLLEQLKSPSFAIVSNACITLSHFSSRSPADQRTMRDLGALKMLHSLIGSKHDTIKYGASKTFHNLFTSQNLASSTPLKESPGMSTSYSMPSSLHIRKMNALKSEFTSCLTENYDALLLPESPNLTPKHTQTLQRNATSKSYSINMMCTNYSNGGASGPNSSASANFHKVTRSSSHDSIGSTHSEPGTKLFNRPTTAQSERKSAVAAYMNLAGNGSPHDQRMVASYSGQTMSSIYATLPANSRISEHKRSLESASDLTSDYDINCSDITYGGQANSNSSSFLVSELDTQDDPEPTDYSQRFQEQLMDDFAAPRSNSKNGSEDTVKVYQTENTPLIYSLAPSLSDLRDLPDQSKQAYSNENDDESKSKLNDLSDRFHSLELAKRPILPPKPGHKPYLPNSNSAYHLKNLGSIHEEGPSPLEENGKNALLSKSISTHDSIAPSPPMIFPRSNSINSVLYENYNLRQQHSGGGGSLNGSGKTPTRAAVALPERLLAPMRNLVTTATLQADTMGQFESTDSSTIFFTEDTPMVFSHRTSLSDLSVEDLEPEASFAALQKEAEKQQQQGQALAGKEQLPSQNAKVTQATHGSSEYQQSPEPDNAASPNAYQDSAIGAREQDKAAPVAAKRMSKQSSQTEQVQFYGQQRDTSPPTLRRPPKKPLPPKPTESIAPPLPTAVDSMNSTNEDDDYDSFIFQCRQPALPKDSFSKSSKSSSTLNSSRKSTHAKSAKSPLPPTPVKPKISPTSKSQSHPVSIDPNVNDADDDDAQLLAHCRLMAISKQSSKTSKRASSNTGKSPRIFKKNPVAQSHHHLANLVKTSVHHSNQQETVHLDQEKQYYVEDTPVHFSQCHSPLSSLCDSGDEMEDHRLLLQAAEHLDACRNEKRSLVKTTAASGAAANPEMSENESESTSATTATLTSSVQGPLTTHVRPNPKSIPANRATATRDTENGKPAMISAVTKGNTNGVMPPEKRKNAASPLSTGARNDNPSSELLDDGADDERTYTICTTNSRLSSAALSSSASVTKGHAKNPLVMSDHSSGAGSMVDLDSTNPPSLLDDHHLMFSSNESNILKSGVRSSAASRAASARLRRNEPNHQQLGHELHGDRQANSFENSPAHSLLENQKPPSIMERSFLMSQSSASISSEISDIALDQVPLRRLNSSSTEMIAEVASNCAKELSNLADLCLSNHPSSPSSHSASLSSSASNNRGRAVTKSTEDLLIEQRADRTFDIELSEPTPNSRTQGRSSTGTGTTTVTVVRPSTNTRTYNKTDRTKNTTDQTLQVGQRAPEDEGDSDTDISEVLPLDEVRPTGRESVASQRQSPTKRVPTAMPSYSNPMDSPKVNQKPPPAPRYQPKAKLYTPSSFELTDDEDDDALPVGYSHSLNIRGRNSRKLSATQDDTASVQLEFGSGSRFGAYRKDSSSEVGTTSNLYHNFAYHSLGRRGNGPNRRATQGDFDDKELLFTAQHRNTVQANHAQFFQNKSNPTTNIKTASKYFDRHAAALSSMAHEDVHQQTRQHQGESPQTAMHPSTYVPLPTSTSKRSASNDARKGKGKGSGKEKSSTSIFSKLSSSFSSHNIGAQSTNSPGNASPQPGAVNSSSKTSFNKINSKISSFWKRSKSTHDKLDHEALTANPGKNMKVAEVNRSVANRRSLGNKQETFDMNQNNEQNVTRSSTYERLPTSDEEAVKANSKGRFQERNNNDCEYVDEAGNGATSCEYEFSKAQCGSPYGVDSTNANLTTFVTFVKGNSSNLGSSFESLSTLSSVDRNAQPKETTGGEFSFRKAKLAPTHSVPVGVSSVEDSSGVSTASSASAQPRKTCLVTTV